MNQKGFTLIEVVITVAVVAFALVAYLGANYAIEKASESAYQKSVAIQDAQQTLERMRSTAATGTFPGNVTSAFSGSISGYSNLPSETVAVSYVDATANPLDTTVTVTYLQNGTRTVTNTIRTLISQRIAAS